MKESFRIVSTFVVEMPKRRWSPRPGGSRRSQSAAAWLSTLHFCPAPRKVPFLSERKMFALIWCHLRLFDLTGWKYLGLGSSRGCYRRKRIQRGSKKEWGQILLFRTGTVGRLEHYHVPRVTRCQVFAPHNTAMLEQCLLGGRLSSSTIHFRDEEKVGESIHTH